MILLLYTDGKNSILHKTFNVYVLMKRYTSRWIPAWAGVTNQGITLKPDLPQEVPYVFK